MLDKLDLIQEQFSQPISLQIWDRKYRFQRPGFPTEQSPDDSFQRVASALAANEPISERSNVSRAFYDAMGSFKLVPGGRILAGAGTGRAVTLCNTFVMPTLDDSVSGIMDTIKQAALTMKMGGGIGFDFSTIRPKGADVRGLDCPAAGPLAAMEICDATCRMIVSGMGRGAMMATLACDHPDIEDFVTAKSDPARLRSFNLSVMISDAFMTALDRDADWPLVWQGKTVRSLRACDLWDTIMRQTYASAEPGVLFIDRINALNPLAYVESVAATNSCAEQPLPPNGACPLASVNLARLVKRPLHADAEIDLAELAQLTRLAVRMLDNVVDLTAYPYEAQRMEALSKRRIGVGVTGLADAFALLGMRYGSRKALAALDNWMRTLKNAAYLASAQLAAKRGAFPLYNASAHLTEQVLFGLSSETAAHVRQHGLRNGVLTSIAPTGTTSMFAGNVSSGIEPIFATAYKRAITGANGVKTLETVEDYAVALFHRQFPGRRLSRPFVTVSDLSPDDHLRVQATAQKWIDAGISKTVNCPETIPFTDFEHIYRQANDMGCKGCTTFRPNEITGTVLSL